MCTANISESLGDFKAPAGEKSYKKTILEPDKSNHYTRFEPNIDVVVDPYTGKYYGQESKEFFTNQFSNSIEEIKASIASTEKYGVLNLTGFPGNQPTNPLGGLGIPTKPLSKDEYLKDLRGKLDLYTKELQQFETNYEQVDRFNESYDLYKDTWDAKFRGDYRNPRIAEDNQTATAVGKQRFEQKVNLQQSLLAISPDSQSTPTPKTVGTGVSNSTAGINPFGAIESGLNI